MSNLTTTIIETERLRMVALSLHYAKDIFTELTPEITIHMFPTSPKEISETEAYIQSNIPKIENGEEFPVVVLHKITGEFLGGSGIHALKTPTPELGIWIKKSAHGNKYGHEAVAGLKKWIDENLTYEYIKYPVVRHNIASRKIAESLGGVVKDEYHKPDMAGVMLDEVEYRIYPTK